jgi:nitrous oxidase accessory protein
MVARGGARVLAAGCLLLVSVASAARTWQVAPGSAIQSAIDAAAAGDTLEIARGHYRENLRARQVPHAARHRSPGHRRWSQGQYHRRVRRARHARGSRSCAIPATACASRTPASTSTPAPTAPRCATATEPTTCSACGSKRPTTCTIEHNLITGKRDYAVRSAATASSSTTPACAHHRQQHQLRARRHLRRCVARRAVPRQPLHHSRYGTHYMNSYRNLWEGQRHLDNRGGLALMEVRDQVVRNNRAWGNSDHGIMLRTIQDAVVENNVVAGNARLLHLRRRVQHPARQPGGRQPDRRAPVGGLEEQHRRGQRLHRQPRAGALRRRAR